MKVYVAGPMRGIKDFNFPAFHECAAMLRELGYTVRNPAEHDEEQGFDPVGDGDRWQESQLDLRESMRWDLSAVLWADAIVVLPGWRNSYGVGVELTVAREVGTPILDAETLLPVDEETISQEANRLVNGARQASYGHPYDDFTRTGKMWAAVLRDWALTVEINHTPDIPPHLVGLCQVGIKISREVNAPKRDNLVDICGYAETVALVRERQASDQR